MIVPNQANVPSIKIGEYAARNPKQYFHLPATEPLPNGSEVHGGQFYDVIKHFDKFVASRKISSSVSFSRNVVDKKKDLARIEKITKNAKIDTDVQGRVKPSTQRRKVAKETKEILFQLMWGNKLKE